MSISVGDFVKGLPGNGYGITNEKMTRGVVTEVYGDNRIRVKVLEHENDNTGAFDVDADKFEVIGHQKPFNREEVLELLKNGCKKAILDYDLSDADLDFSCWPLWCGGLKVKTDKRLACQLAYHLCTMQCDDEEYIKMRNSILAFANQFHKVNECGRLEEIEIEHIIDGANISTGTMEVKE